MQCNTIYNKVHGSILKWNETNTSSSTKLYTAQIYDMLGFLVTKTAIILKEVVTTGSHLLNVSSPLHHIRDSQL